MFPAALIFDLDGVIVKTNFTKHEAMLSLFADFPDRQDSISAFILSNGGVPRREKLRRILGDCLQIEPVDPVLSHYLAQYAARLEQHLVVTPLVEGVFGFISSYQGSRYVCSSAPEAEVYEQLARCSLQSYFAAIYEGTTPKYVALREIAALHVNQPVVFFGDSVGDFEASRQANVDFIGIVCERDNFNGLPVVKLKDFTSAAAIEQALSRSAAQGAA